MTTTTSTRRARGRAARTLAAAGVVLVLAAGCGWEVAPDPVADDGPSNEPTTTAGTVTTPVGPRPVFTADDYTYTLRVSCYCPDAGQPVRVTVADGRVTAADRVGPSGEGRALEAYRYTIPEVIARALDPRVDEVRLRWPADQAWPTVASLDPITQGVDDEVSYEIADVTILS